MLREARRHRRTNTVRFHSHEVPGGVTSTETGSRWWGLGLGEVWGVRVSWGQSFSLGRWKTPGDGWWGQLHDNVNVLNATELCT